MRKILIIFILSAVLPLASCDRKGGVNDAPVSEVTGPTANMSAEYDAFATAADSILNTLDGQLKAYDGKLGNPGRRRHVVRQRREVIQAQYRLDKLREQLQKRSRSYRAAVQELKRIEKSNPQFIRQYEDDLHLFEGSVGVLLKDTLP
jgi:hypothetical protein